jgi:hypothetical protein
VSTVDGQELWAIACYFNPMGWQRRLDNFRRFRRALTVPLLAVELSYRGEYELQSDDATRLLRLRGHDVMWHKERLLNLAVAALPEGCRVVAWLDGDVLFRDDDWPHAALKALERVSLVQLFRRARYTGPGFLLTGDPSIVWDRPGLGAGIDAGLTPLECLLHPSPEVRPKTYATGLAWAARRDLLLRHGFYEASIVGGGDRAFVCAGLGCFDYVIRSHHLNPRQTDHYHAWARPFHASVRGMVGAIDGEILHLWHGDRSDRGYGARHDGLARFDFDPRTDIAPEPGGVYRWASPKPDLHAFVAHYFASRREDGE